MRRPVRPIGRFLLELSLPLFRSLPNGVREQLIERGVKALIPGMRPEQIRALLGRIVTGLPPQDVLEIKSNLNIRAKLDYSKADIFLEMNAATEVPRQFACAKEPWTVKWIEEFVKDGDIFFDVGANVGAYSLIAAERCGKGGRVFAFEPGFETFPALCRNIRLNNRHNVVVPIPLALGSTSHLEYFNYFSLGAGTALHTLGEEIDYQGRPFLSAYRQPVAAVCIDDAIGVLGFPTPNHIKIDVDGTELDVIHGGVKTLSNKNVRTMMVEICEQRASIKMILDVLTPIGWILAQRYDRPQSARTPHDVSYLLLVR